MTWFSSQVITVARRGRAPRRRSLLHAFERDHDLDLVAEQVGHVAHPEVAALHGEARLVADARAEAGDARRVANELGGHDDLLLDAVHLQRAGDLELAGALRGHRLRLE